MDCLTCQEHFTELLEAPTATSPVARHVAACPQCTEAFAQFRQTVRDLRSLPVVPPPPDLLQNIMASVDAVPAPRVAGPGLWQPLTAGLAMAACLCLVLWTVVLHPVEVGVDPSGSQVAYSGPAQPTTTAAGGTPAVPVTATAPSRAPERGVRRVARPGFVRGGRMAMPARPGQAPPAAEPPSFGGWGERLAQLPAGSTPATSGNGGKPAGTFADPGTVTPERPLHRQAGDVQLSFAPPVERTVGAPVVGELTLSGLAEAMVVVRVTADPGLRVTNARDGVAYRGPLYKGEALKVPLRLLAWKAGTHRLRVQLQSDVAGVAGDLEITISDFAGEIGKNGEALVSLSFNETPSRKAIRQLAAAAGARVVIHEEIERKLVTLDFSAGVPFAAALRILCDDCGYHLQERNGVYHVLR